MTASKCYTLANLIDGLDVTVKGDQNCLITGISPIHQSLPGHITFLNNSLYRKHLETTKASAVILSEKDAALCPVYAIISSNPYYTYAKIATFFVDQPEKAAGAHLSALIDESAVIDPQAQIAANCVIGKGVKIAAHVFIASNCVIGDYAEIGEGTHLESNVVIHHHVKLGKRNKIASGVVIGSDGFGFAEHGGVWHKVPQLGTVVVGNDVDIGANTTIDRGALENTVIEDGVKLDNLIQVGHNVRIGAHTIIAGCVGIAGSAVIGKHCMIGGATCIAGHIQICDKTMITGMTGVSKSITEPGIYSSGIVGAVPNLEFRKNNARFHRLENLMDRVKSLETALLQLKERN